MKSSEWRNHIRVLLSAVSILTLFVLSPIGSRAAFAGGGNQGGNSQGGNGGGGTPLQAPEFDATNATQALVLVVGALIVLRRSQHSV
jgi:hypothetical protein